MIWMAAPPEVHSALLSLGPGAESLLTAAAAWESLSIEYAAAAAEISDVVTAVGAGWEGSGAESWSAAQAPYVAWLLDASADGAAAAAQHEVAAAAYTAALAAMPTLAELAANHATHAALVATNFFGINTVPIALNEADYVRMWIQAATTMATYQSAATAAVASTPTTSAAPPIVRSAGSAASLDPGRAMINAIAPILERFGINGLIRNPLVSNPLTDLISDFLEIFGIYWDSGAGTLNGLGYESYADATQPMWYLARGLELIGDTMQMSQNPTQAIQYFLALSLLDWPTHVAQLGTAITQSPLLLAAAGGAMLVPAASAGGLTGLAGLAGAPTPTELPAPAPIPAAVDLPAAGMTSSPTSIGTASTAGSASAPAPSAAPTSTATAPSAPAPPAAGFTPPYLVGPPGIGFGSGMAAGASASAKKKASEPDSAAEAAKSSAALRRQARLRQRTRTTQRGYGDEFMDMDVDVEPLFDEPPDDATASGQGAGSQGLAGTLPHDTVGEAAGLTKLVDDDFGGGPIMPMLPNTWQ
ncbi:hypothetical protein A5645_10835 [Mycobacterium asiaticum]|uniref:PPE family protein n=1 Tax=Mycobacterium asiaticum TaxID=1790 RepID=UPI0007F002D6|nr:PPE family protein [Mycobacterium asiaticum]OBK96009.1 hypothetical protein A5645_10835 [Mycobacterium asiaticum]